MIPDNLIPQSLKDKKKLNLIFLGSMLILETILFVSIIIILVKLIGLHLDKPNEAKQFYSLCGMGLMLIWIGVLFAYYAWAIYFYNINLGLTNQDWAEIRERKKYVQEGQTDEPTENPNAGQTLGLPPGTLRGTIALTLLVCSIALAIASLGMDSNVKVNTFLVDNFDFFKTAFLMMIAFYFGNKALETIGYKNTKTISGGAEAGKDANANKTTAEAGSIAPVSPVTGAATEKKNQLQQNPIAESLSDKLGSDDFDNPKAVQ